MASARWRTRLSNAATGAGGTSTAATGRRAAGFAWTYWHRIVLMSFLGWIFMYADRTVLSPVLPLIHAEWGVSKSQLGLISSLFFLAYAAVQIPVGWASDRLGRRLALLVPGFILFGLGTLATGLAPSYGFILAAGLVTGLGQGAYYPTQFSLSTEVVPPERRGLAAALINSGQAVGISLGLVVASLVALAYGGGWRLPFVVLSVPTVLVGLLFLKGVKPEHDRRARAVRGEPAAREAPGTNAREAAPDAVDAAAPAARPAHLWTPRLVSLYVVNFCSLYGFFVVLTWLPFYLQTARGYGGAQVGWISSLVPWAAVVGGIVASVLSDRVPSRKPVAMSMLPVAALALAGLPLVHAKAVLVAALLVYGFFGKLALDPVLAAMVADSTEPHLYGRVFGVFNFAGMTSSILAPYLTGFLADRSGALDAGFYLAAAFLLAGMLALAFFRAPGAARDGILRHHPTAMERGVAR